MSSCTLLAAEKLQRFELVRQSFLSRAGLPFDTALPEELIQQAAEEEGIDFVGFAADQWKAIYTPAVTLGAFLSQMPHANKQRACLAAARVAALLASQVKRGCASNRGAYCRSRAKLTWESYLSPRPAARSGGEGLMQGNKRWKALRREIFGVFKPGDVFLADR